MLRLSVLGGILAVVSLGLPGKDEAPVEAEAVETAAAVTPTAGPVSTLGPFPRLIVNGDAWARHIPLIAVDIYADGSRVERHAGVVTVAAGWPWPIPARTAKGRAGGPFLTIAGQRVPIQPINPYVDADGDGWPDLPPYPPGF